MNDKKFYLDSSTMFEPLIDHWYAWPYLVAPATSAMIVKNLHFPLLESYLQNPAIHAAAAANANLRGGPYLDFSGDIDSIRKYFGAYQASSPALIELADAITKTSQTLGSTATGDTLRDSYAQVAPALKGYVELVYDLEHHATLRFIEALLYKSPYYNRARQAINLTPFVKGYERSFALSTPRFEEPGGILLNMPFDHPAIDEIFRSRSRGIASERLTQLADSLFSDAERKERFLSLFTETAPAPTDADYQGDGVRVRYFGHATVLIQTDSLSILVDPLVSYDADNHDIDRFSYKDLPEQIDYVLLTHNHQDHISFETLLQIRHRVRHIIVPRNSGGALQDPSLRLILENTGFKNVIELDELQSVNDINGTITGLPFFGEHGDLDIHSKLAFHVNLKGVNIICAADSNNIEPRLYEHLKQELGHIHALFIGMECAGAPVSWLYGPLFYKPIDRRKDQSRRLDGSNCERARNAIESLRPDYVAVYAMGAEPWLTYISSISYTETSVPIIESDQLIKECGEIGIPCERLYGKKELVFNEGSIAG